jgi:hypothetical protein
MCWQADRVYFCDWTAPHTARGFCTDHLTAAFGYGAEAQPAIDDTVTVVSELITNAVQSGCASTELRLDVHRDHVRVAVTDDSPGEPRLLNPGPSEERGRGLRLVDELSSSWGVTPLDHGKQVWAVVAATAPLLDGIECTLVR